MSYGEIIRMQRGLLGLTQRELGDKIGCTDGYIAHLERQVKIPSYDLVMAMVGTFQFTAEEEQDFLKSVDAAKSSVSQQRIRTRGAAVRGFLRHRVSPAGGEKNHADAQRIAQDLNQISGLKEAYQDLKTALSNPQIRDIAIETLRAFARKQE